MDMKMKGCWGADGVKNVTTQNLNHNIFDILTLFLYITFYVYYI